MRSIHKIGAITTIIAAIAIVYLTQAFASHTFEVRRVPTIDIRRVAHH